jgi:hypothetical protein
MAKAVDLIYYAYKKQSALIHIRRMSHISRAGKFALATENERPPKILHRSFAGTMPQEAQPWRWESLTRYRFNSTRKSDSEIHKHKRPRAFLRMSARDPGIEIRGVKYRARVWNNWDESASRLFYPMGARRVLLHLLLLWAPSWECAPEE